MNQTANGNIRTIRMSDKDFNRLSGFIQSELGIKMPPAKKIMLESRLQKRLRLLKLNSLSEYCDYLFSPEGMENELVQMIDLVTTNKTEFFREANHFDYLVHTAIPDLIRTCEAGIKRKLIVWSAGCSTGEEPYTLAMVINEFADRHYKTCPRNSLSGNGFDYLIIATDISTRVLEITKKGIYKEERLTPVPVELRRKYFLRSKDKNKGLVRIAPELRSRVRFRRLNFMENDFGFREPIDIIFCRNVIIYFDKDTQERLFNRFYRYLIPNGYIFTGHSETLNNINVPLVKAAPSVYRKER